MTRRVRMVPSIAPEPVLHGEGVSWHATSADDVVRLLESDPELGLSAREAARRLARFGPNTVEVSRRVTWIQILGRQFVSAVVVILLVAAAIALSVGHVTDALTILAIVVLNGILGFVQEWKAERALAALQRLLCQRCVACRDGAPREVDAATLVPGDVVRLSIGDNVPADLRLLRAVNLRIDESVLTGESAAVSKRVEAVRPEAPLAERTSVALAGTAVTNGRADGVVVATGMATEFGRIALLTQSIEEEATPLQRKLAVLGKQLGVFAITVAALVALIGWLTGKPPLEMFFAGVSLAVAVVPEGLPAVVTITLALGIRTMVRRKALLRRLQAAEVLGASTVICTDKTGTLTENEMTVLRVWLPGGAVDVTGAGYAPVGEFEVDGRAIAAAERADLARLLETGVRCNHARIIEDESGWREIGEPTEAALVVAARKAALDVAAELETVTEFSFNSARKRMTVVQRCADGLVAHVKGAPEVLLERSSMIVDGDIERELSGADRDAFVRAYTSMAGDGLRTLALARRVLPDGCPLDEDAVETGLTLLGVVGIIDPPRPEVPEALRVAAEAGIRVVMITGDAAATALAIAERIGLRCGGAVTGAELEGADDPTLRGWLADDVLFARVSPEQKLRIVSLLKERGDVVSMTGDGVNDAPALKKADVGIAMGLRGTDVARGAADVVLTDDNFASIVSAVEEGRRQYENIQKFVRYLLSSNVGEVVAIFVNIVIGGPLILLPVQILWMNLVTDGMTAVALGVERAESGLMKRPPYSPRSPVLDRAGILTVLSLGTYIGVATLCMYYYYLKSGDPGRVAVAQTVAFTGIIVAEKMNVLNFRSLGAPLIQVGLLSNPWVLLALAATFGLQVCAVYAPPLQRALHTTPLELADWALMVAVAAPVFIVPESLKCWRALRKAAAARS